MGDALPQGKEASWLLRSLHAIKWPAQQSEACAIEGGRGHPRRERQCPFRHGGRNTGVEDRSDTAKLLMGRPA